MIATLLERLRLVQGFEVEEGFYSHAGNKSKFIFVQPYDSDPTVPSGTTAYTDDLQLQVVVGIKLSSTETPTADLINAVREIRDAFYGSERTPSKPGWLKGAISFVESEKCKFIMPEPHEKHGIAVLTLTIKHLVKFGESL